MSGFPTKKKHNALGGKNKAMNTLIFKECLVIDIIITLPVDQVSMDGTMITVHKEHINTEAEIDPRNWTAK